MGIGTGVVFLAAGAILYWAVDIDLPYIDDNALGGILIVAGIIAVAAAVIMNSQRSQTSVGSGIGLIVAGAVVYTAVDVNLPFVFDGALGVILMLAGVITVIATVVMHSQQHRTRHVVERRPRGRSYDHGPDTRFDRRYDTAHDSRYDTRYDRRYQ